MARTRANISIHSSRQQRRIAKYLHKSLQESSAALWHSNNTIVKVNDAIRTALTVRDLVLNIDEDLTVDLAITLGFHFNKLYKSLLTLKNDAEKMHQSVDSVVSSVEELDHRMTNVD